MKTPTWEELEEFCRIDRWQEIDKSDDHRYYQLVHGRTVLQTRVSHSSKKTMSEGRWSSILRDQLQVSADDFWKALRTGDPVQRPSQPPDESRGIPLWCAQVLENELHMAPAEIAGLEPDEAQRLVHEFWSRPR